MQAATGTKGKKTDNDSGRQPSLETTWDKTKMLSAKSQEYRRLTKSDILFGSRYATYFYCG